MRTKSLRIASPVSRSTIRSPACPPARPVATTGTPSSFSARATFSPLPPASGNPALARWRWPRWKFGTVIVRANAALRVTVTIMTRLREKTRDVLHCTGRVPADTAGDAGGGDGARGDEAPGAEEARPHPDLDAAEHLALVDGQ